MLEFLRVFLILRLLTRVLRFLRARWIEQQGAAAAREGLGGGASWIDGAAAWAAAWAWDAASDSTRAAARAARR